MAHIKVYVNCPRHRMKLTKESNAMVYLKITKAQAKSDIYDPKSIKCQQCQRCLR